MKAIDEFIQLVLEHPERELIDLLNQFSHNSSKTSEENAQKYGGLFIAVAKAIRETPENVREILELEGEREDEMALLTIKNFKEAANNLEQMAPSIIRTQIVTGCRISVSMNTNGKLAIQYQSLATPKEKQVKKETRDLIMAAQSVALSLLNVNTAIWTYSPEDAAEQAAKIESVYRSSIAEWLNILFTNGNAWNGVKTELNYGYDLFLATILETSEEIEREYIKSKIRVINQIPTLPDCAWNFHVGMFLDGSGTEKYKGQREYFRSVFSPGLSA